MYKALVTAFATVELEISWEMLVTLTVEVKCGLNIALAVRKVRRIPYLWISWTMNVGTTARWDSIYGNNVKIYCTHSYSTSPNVNAVIYIAPYQYQFVVSWWDQSMALKVLNKINGFLAAFSDKYFCKTKETF